MAKEDLSWIKGLKNRPDYSKEEVRLLAGNPNESQEFIDKTREVGGASINLRSKKVAQPGESLFFVGKEPSKKTKQPVKTEFVDPGKRNPNLSAKEFSSNFTRLAGEASNRHGFMGSWVDEEAPEKGVQIDLSAGYKTKKAAEKKMVERNEDAIFDLKNMKNIRNEDVRQKYSSEPRPPKVN